MTTVNYQLSTNLAGNYYYWGNLMDHTSAIRKIIHFVYDLLDDELKNVVAVAGEQFEGFGGLQAGHHVGGRRQHTHRVAFTYPDFDRDCAAVHLLHANALRVVCRALMGHRLRGMRAIPGRWSQEGRQELRAIGQRRRCRRLQRRVPRRASAPRHPLAPTRAG